MEAWYALERVWENSEERSLLIIKLYGSNFSVNFLFPWCLGQCAWLAGLQAFLFPK